MNSVGGISNFDWLTGIAFANSPRALAILDLDLIVVHCNPALELLFESPPVGRSILELFPQNQDHVRNLCAGAGSRRLERMYLRPQTEGIDRVATVEFGRVQHDGKSFVIGIIADVSTFVAEDLAALDAAEFGVVRIDASENPYVKYVNRRGAELLGHERGDLLGKHVPLETIFTSGPALEVLTQQRLKRRAGNASHYAVSAHADGQGGGHPLEIFALPDYDPSGQEVVGTTAIISSRLRQQVVRRLHGIMDRFASRPHSMAREGLAQIRRVVPHDFATLVIHHGDWAHAAHLEPIQSPDWESRWFCMGDAVLKAMRTLPDRPGADNTPLGGAIFPEISTVFNGVDGAEVLSQNKVVLRLVDEGYRRVLVLPLKGDGDWRASLFLLRRGSPFGEADLHTLRDELGVLGFLQATLDAFERRSSRLRSSLRNQIREAGSLDAAGKILPQQLTHHHQWQHTALLRCRYAEGGFSLVEEAGEGTDPIVLGPDFRQSFDKGQLGLAFGKGEPVVLNDVSDESLEAREFLPNSPQTRSCLTYPIMLGDLLSGNRKRDQRPVGMLHIQSTSVRAFPPPIVKEIRRYVQVIEETLYGAQRDSLIATLQQEAPSGLLLSDRSGVIWGLNETVIKMLGLSPFKGERPMRLNEVFYYSQDVHIALQPLSIRKHQATLRHQSGAKVMVLVDGANLRTQGTEGRTHIGLRLIQFTDLKSLTWEHDIKSVKAAVAGVTAEIKPHLATAFGLIRNLQKNTADDTARQTAAERLTETLSLARVTTERVLNRLEPVVEGSEVAEPKLQTDMRSVLLRVLERIEQRARDHLIRYLNIRGADFTVRMSETELAMIFETILDYMVVRRPVKSPLRTLLQVTDNVVSARFRARLGEMNLDAADSMTRAYRLGMQFAALNEDGLSASLGAHQGTFRHKLENTGYSTMIVSLPLHPATEGGGV